MRRMATSMISAAVVLLATAACTDKSPTASQTRAVRLDASPASLSLAPSAASAISTISITRSGGFTGAVTFELSGAPAGMTATFEPSTTVGDSSILTLHTDSNVVAGMYPVTVTAAAPGVANQTVVTVTVLPLTVITLQSCFGASLTWFLYQNTGGAWTSVVPSANQTVTFPATPTLGIAFLRVIGGRALPDDPNRYTLEVVYASAVQQQGFLGCSSAASASKDLSGTVTGLSASETAYISMGSQSVAYSLPSPTFTLHSVREGPTDLVARRVGSPTVVGNSTFTVPNALIIRRGLNLPSGSTIPLLDFASAEAFAPVPATMNVTGAGPDTVDVNTVFRASGGTDAGLWAGSNVAPSSTVWALPESQLVAGDFYQVNVNAYLDRTRAHYATRTAATYAQHLDGITIALGAPLNTPTVSVSNAAPRVRLQLVSQTDYPSSIVAYFVQVNASSFAIDATVWATAEYFGGTPNTWDIRLPDLNLWARDTPWYWEVSASSAAFLAHNGFTTVLSATRGGTAATP